MSDHGYFRISWVTYETFSNEFVNEMIILWKKYVPIGYPLRREGVEKFKEWHMYDALYSSPNCFNWIPVFIGIYQILKSKIEGTECKYIEFEDRVDILYQPNEECDLAHIKVSNIPDILNASLIEDNIQHIWKDDWEKMWRKING